MGIVEFMELSTHVHATEDEDKVRRALLNLLPPDLRVKVRPVVTESSGYFGNTIKVLSLGIRGGDAERALGFMLRSMDETDREVLRASLENRIEGSRLFIRFDKQMAYKGVIRLSDGDDVVKVTVGMNPWRLRELGLEEALRRVGGWSY
jgi:hypothetical protein